MKIVVADGHPTMRFGIKGLLPMEDDVRVVGETGDGEETIRLVEKLRPDLVILGLNLTGRVDGVEACRRLKEMLDPPRVLVHATHSLSNEASSSLLAEADGYLHKYARPEELLNAIRRTAAAGNERVWRSENAVGKARLETQVVPKESDLTSKEREVFALILRRYSNVEVADELHLRIPTVKTHVRKILRKMEAKNRKELLGSHAPGAPSL